jgi:N-acyl-phosphatidylethanolamine-hydrolysing phospholipase D
MLKLRPITEMANLIPSHKPSWDTGSDSSSNDTSSKIKSTWLGHAAVLVELPTPPGAIRGPRVLFDPVLSHRCSPISFIGPQRFTPTPVVAQDLPAIDAIVISHNHYDHMDAETLKTLRIRNEGKIHIFAPLGNEDHIKGFGFDPEHIHCMDWWEVRKLGLSIPAVSASAEKAIETGVEITCTPAQHTANRSVNDRWRTLWSSWAVRSLLSKSDSDGSVTTPERGVDGTGVYFGGDTAYRTVRDGEDEDKVPTNPEFKEIGHKFGGFELALLPIG